jgi:cell division septal protein FtsQ
MATKISSKYQKDFKNMDYKNPRLIRDKEKRQARIKKMVFLLVGVLIVAFLYFIFYSAYFRIETVEVNGLHKIKQENFDKLIDEYRNSRHWFIFSHNNFWLHSKKELTSRIFEHYHFEEFGIKKKWPNKLVIELKEKESAINWLTNNLCYHLDLTGVAVEYCETNNGYLTIKDLKDNDARIGGQVVEKNELEYIVDLYNQSTAITRDKYTLLSFEKTDNLIELKTEQGTVLKFNTNLTVAEQVARLDTLMKNTDLKDNLNNLQYIDLRFGEKVYYK